MLASQPARRPASAPATPLLFDPRSGVALELLPKEEVEELVLEEIPDVSYEDIGGLEGQIEAIRDAVELPFLYAELFHEHELEPPKGVLLYGPPGMRQDADREGRRRSRWPRRSPSGPAATTPAATS